MVAIMLKELATRMSINDVITSVFGLTAAVLVAFKFPQPYFGMAFWLYSVGAMCGIISNYRRKNVPYVLLFTGFFLIDTYGIYNWWPW